MKQLHTIAPFPSSNFICKRRVGLFQDPSVFKTFRVTMEDCRSATYVVNRYPPPAYSYPSPLSSKSKPAALPAFVCDSICSSQFYGDIMLITRDKILNRKAICKHSQKDSKDKKKNYLVSYLLLACWITLHYFGIHTCCLSHFKYRKTFIRNLVS